MKSENTFILFFKYLKEYRFYVLTLVIFALIFAGIFALYDLQTEAVLYASALCLTIGSIIIIINFIQFLRRRIERRQLFENIQIMTQKLPEPINCTEADYVAIIERLREIMRDDLLRYQSERTDIMDYYTTWVHQIKTPISVMQMILQSEDTEEHRELSAELFRIEQYAEMALTYLRLDSSSNDLVIKQYRLDPIIRGAIHKYAPQFIKKKIQLKYKGTDEIAVTDEKWLTFIIEQLLSNAVKYTESGYVEITVDDDLRLTVSDSGIGIAEEDVPRIFEKGFTGYNGRENSKSTGLGLYLTKKAADKLGHKLSASSEIGKGSDFSICLKNEITDLRYYMD